MEWEIPVLNDLNMATFATSCADGVAVNFGMCTGGSGARNKCQDGSSFGTVTTPIICDTGGDV